MTPDQIMAHALGVRLDESLPESGWRKLAADVDAKLCANRIVGSARRNEIQALRQLWRDAEEDRLRVLDERDREAGRARRWKMLAISALAALACSIAMRLAS